MSGLRELTQKYASKLKDMPEKRKEFALKIAFDSFALVAYRIQNYGIDANGNKMKGYSTAKMPYWKLDPTDYNGSGKVSRFKKDAADGKVIPSYKTFREYYGLPTDKRTLTFDGDMFKSIEPFISEHTEVLTEVTIKSKDEKNQKKVNVNSNIVGINILSFGDDEKDFIREANEKRVNDFFKN